MSRGRLALAKAALFFSDSDIRALQLWALAIHTLGRLEYVYYWTIARERISEFVKDDEEWQEMGEDLAHLQAKIRQLRSFSELVDSLLYSDPDLVSVEECRQAAGNDQEIRRLKRFLRQYRQEKFHYLIQRLPLTRRLAQRIMKEIPAI